MTTSAFIKTYLDNRFVKPKAIEWNIREDRDFTNPHIVLTMSNSYTQKKNSRVFEDNLCVSHLLVGEIIRLVEGMILDLNAENIEPKKHKDDVMDSIIRLGDWYDALEIKSRSWADERINKEVGWSINPTKYERHPSVEKVIFNNPATIVFWKDGTKTVVKCKDGEEYDKWTGLAMCHMKKLYGKKFHKTFRDLCDKEEEDTSDILDYFSYFRSMLGRGEEK